jgi:hypothetical protein
VGAYSAAIAAYVAMGFVAQSCAVMSSGEDCTATATCADDGPTAADGSHVPNVGREGAIAETGGDDRDVMSEGAVGNDVASEGVTSGGDARDVASEDLAIRPRRPPFISRTATARPDSSGRRAELVSESERSPSPQWLTPMLVVDSGGLTRGRRAILDGRVRGCDVPCPETEN